MKSSLFRSVVRAVGVSLLVSLLAGCGARSAPMRILDLAPPRTGERKFATTASYLGMFEVHSGQLILTESPDNSSLVFLLAPAQFYPFTHMGVISVEDGVPWVYDITGDIKTIPIRSRPMDNIDGRMYRRQLHEFVIPNLYAEIYEPPEGTDPEKLALWMREKYRDHVPFDAYFNWEDHESFFCTELVELGIRQAGGKPHEPVPTSKQPSVQMGMKWLGVPTQIALPAGIYADPTRYVGSLGQFRTRTQAYSYFAGKRELYERFSQPDQRLGFMFSLSSMGVIGVRPHITAFMNDAITLFDDDPKPPKPGDPRLAAAVHALADKHFGALP